VDSRDADVKEPFHGAPHILGGHGRLFGDRDIAASGRYDRQSGDSRRNGRTNADHSGLGVVDRALDDALNDFELHGGRPGEENGIVPVGKRAAMLRRCSSVSFRAIDDFGEALSKRTVRVELDVAISSKGSARMRLRNASSVTVPSRRPWIRERRVFSFMSFSFR
jgi:hypothetical protein